MCAGVRATAACDGEHARVEHAWFGSASLPVLRRCGASTHALCVAWIRRANTASRHSSRAGRAYCDPSVGPDEVQNICDTTPAWTSCKAGELGLQETAAWAIETWRMTAVRKQSAGSNLVKSAHSGLTAARTQQRSLHSRVSSKIRESDETRAQCSASFEWRQLPRAEASRLQQATWG